MRDSLNINIVPFVQDNLDGAAFNLNMEMRGISNISSNGYYGYQAPVYDRYKNRRTENNQDLQMTTDMEVNFHNIMDCNAVHAMECNIRRDVNRKRAWEYSNDSPEFKKRRANEPDSPTPLLSTMPLQKTNCLRQPTHNIPDLPRCIMEEKQQVSSGKNEMPKKNQDILLEELLRGIHGANYYEWVSH